MRPLGQARRVRAPGILTVALVTLAACGDSFLGEKETEPPLPGERVSILALEGNLVVDERLSDLDVVLPEPVGNTDWPQPGGNAANAIGHPALDTPLERIWRVDIGAGSDSERVLIAPPIVRDGRIFAVDASGVLSAFATDTGRRIWQSAITGAEDDLVYGGGITSGEGRIFASTGWGEVLALDAEDGSILWRARATGPLRSAPTYAAGRLFVTSIDNQSVAFSAGTGERLWSHAGISEDALLLGRAQPAVVDDVVVVPYSSGQLLAMKAETGRVFWADSLASVRGSDTVSSIADIRGHPVVDRNRVIAISHSGKIAALALRTGEAIWDQQVGGVNMPWVVGDFVFVVSNDSEVVCLTLDDGRVRWLTLLPQYTDPEDREGPIQYAGPVLAGNTLYVASSTGLLYRISPQDGAIRGETDIGRDLFIAPVVAGGTLYLLDDDGGLSAWR